MTIDVRTVHFDLGEPTRTYLDKKLERIAYAKGFLMVASSPLTRSSYHAGDDFARMRSARGGRSSQR